MFNGFGLGAAEDTIQRVKTFVASKGGYDAFTPSVGTDEGSLTTCAKLLVESIAYVRQKELELLGSTNTTSAILLKSQIQDGKNAVRGMGSALQQAWYSAIYEVGRGAIEHMATLRFLYNLIKDVLPVLLAGPGELTINLTATPQSGFRWVVRGTPRVELIGLSLNVFASEPMLWFPELLSTTQQAALVAQASLDAVYAKIENMRAQLNAAKNALAQEKSLLTSLMEQAKALGIVIT